MASKDPYNSYLEDFGRAVTPHSERWLEYEGRSLEAANSALRALTYLNGGALVAIPAAVALFQADVASVKLKLIFASLCFISGLLCVVGSMASSYFTLSRRSEAEQYYESEEINRLLYRHAEDSDSAKLAGKITEALNRTRADRTEGNNKLLASNWWRAIGLALFWVSMVLFVIGCGLGAFAVIG